MKFMLEFDFPGPQERLSVRKPVYLAGSCFAEHIGSRLARYKFSTSLNPNGIIFNPVSLFGHALAALNKIHFSDNQIFMHNGLWHSWEHHGCFSQKEKHALEKSIVESMKQSAEIIAAADWLIFTFGSAWVYENKKTDTLVANCHKVPQAEFSKRLLTVGEIIRAFSLLAEHPAMKEKKVMLSISPVRYTRDGLIENNHSKATLIRAVNEICTQFPQVYYFPAYEIVTDELRDYRFFEKDMVHPNTLAVDYVWKRFTEKVFDAEALAVSEEMDRILPAVQHRAMNADTDEYRIFRKNMSERIASLSVKYPFLDLKKEAEHFA